MRARVGAIVFTCTFFWVGSLCRGDILYVDASASGANDGTSWCDAFVNLQDALAVPPSNAASSYEIRVASGTYKPDAGGGKSTGDPSATFQLSDGVLLSGSFAGCLSIDPNQRDFEVHATVLSGDLFGDDLANFVNYEENSFSVVRADGVVAAIDGFVIEHGNGVGGGLRVSRSTVAISNCVFRANSGSFGGALLADGDVFINDTRFIGNKGGNGGGVHNIGDLTIERVVFVDNSAGYGGAIHMPEGSLTAVNSIFAGNAALHRGGGIFAGRDVPRIQLDRCIVVGNQADFGGGLDLFEANLKLYNSLVVMNTASLGGGMLLDECFGDNQIVHSTVANNRAETGGGLYGAACNYPDQYAVANSIFRDNEAVEGRQVFLDGCGHDGPIDLFAVSYSSIEQGAAAIPVGDHWSLIWGDGNMDADPNFQEGPAAAWTGAAVFDADRGQTVLINGSATWVPDALAGKVLNPDVTQPLGFLIAGNDRTSVRVWGDASLLGIPGVPFAVHNFRLKSDSPCIDAGTDLVSAGDFDFDGRSRFLGASADMGAFEYGDCDINGIFDADDIAGGGAADCDEDGVPDVCNLMSGLVEDCSLNGIPDHCEGDLACDGDGDGVPDGEDACPVSDMRPVVVLGDCDTGIANVMAHKGCMLADQLAECDPKERPRGRFVRCVGALSREWRSDGLITVRERARLMVCAARD